MARLTIGNSSTEHRRAVGRLAGLARTSMLLALVVAGSGLAGCEARLNLGSTCVFNSECPEPLACRNARCRTECLTARDCPRGSVCLAAEGGTAACQIPDVDVCEDMSGCGGLLVCAEGRCTNGCALDGDCLPGARCSPTAGCVECVGPEDCPQGLRCDRASNTCVPECRLDGECTEGLACRGGRCVQAMDAALADAGPTDASSPDAGPDASSTDAGSMDASSTDAGPDASSPDAGPRDGGRPPCPAEGCMPPFPSDGTAGDLILLGTDTTVLEPGIYEYDRIEIGANATLRTTGAGVLDLRARREIIVRGVIDVRGGAGTAGATNFCSSSPAGGRGGRTAVPSASALMSGCAVGGDGGLGDEGGRGSGPCANGGANGGGGGGATGASGGGGGGYAGGGGGAARALDSFGGSGAREPAVTMGGNGGVNADGVVGGGRGGYASVAPYAASDGQPGGCTFGGGGGGGSIGEDAAVDLAVTRSFRPGSGGGGGGAGVSGSYCGGGGGGGGGGGALRLASHVRITLGSSARVLATGGRGGAGSGTVGVAGSGSGAGGGGSGGVIYLAAPTISAADGAIIDATGGPGGALGHTCASGSLGGAGGDGRIRLSVEPSSCSVTDATWNPPLPESGCAPDPIGTPGEAFIDAYPY